MVLFQSNSDPLPVRLAVDGVPHVSGDDWEAWAVCNEDEDWVPAQNKFTDYNSPL
jgi:hypothetical protein